MNLATPRQRARLLGLGGRGHAGRGHGHACCGSIRAQLLAVVARNLLFGSLSIA